MVLPDAHESTALGRPVGGEWPRVACRPPGLGLHGRLRLRRLGVPVQPTSAHGSSGRCEALTIVTSSTSARVMTVQSLICRVEPARLSLALVPYLSHAGRASTRALAMIHSLVCPVPGAEVVNFADDTIRTRGPCTSARFNRAGRTLRGSYTSPEPRTGPSRAFGVRMPADIDEEPRSQPVWPSLEKDDGTGPGRRERGDWNLLGRSPRRPRRGRRCTRSRSRSSTTKPNGPRRTSLRGAGPADAHREPLPRGVTGLGARGLVEVDGPASWCAGRNHSVIALLGVSGTAAGTESVALEVATRRGSPNRRG